MEGVRQAGVGPTRQQPAARGRKSSAMDGDLMLVAAALCAPHPRWVAHRLWDAISHFAVVVTPTGGRRRCGFYQSSGLPAWPEAQLVIITFLIAAAAAPSPSPLCVCACVWHAGRCALGLEPDGPSPVSLFPRVSHVCVVLMPASPTSPSLPATCTLSHHARPPSECLSW
mgnify:CR=1 FL=1